MKVFRLGSSLVIATILVVACSSDDSSTTTTPTPTPNKTVTGADAGTTPANATFSVGGSVSGLLGTGLVLQNNGGDDFTVGADGTFTFPTKLAKGAAFLVSIKTQPSAPSQTCTLSAESGTVTGDVTTIAVNCSSDKFTIGGNVTGLKGSGLTLQDNAGDDLLVTGDGAFAFPTPVASGEPFKVTVKAQPNTPSQTCVVTQAEGTVGSAKIADVAVVCTTNKFTVGGTVSGLLGTGLKVLVNGVETVPVAANGTFTFPTAIPSGTAYTVSVSSQPTGPTQVCSVAGGTGVVGSANVTSVALSCSTSKFLISGTASGLLGSAVLQNNGGDNLTVSANGTFSFPTGISSGAAYNVTVKTQPGTPSQTCTLANPVGSVAAANITNVALTCVTNAFKVNGTATGVKGTGLILQNKAGDDLAVAADGTFSFPTSILSGQTYAVTVKANPTSPSQSCVVSSGTGTVGAADVANVAVACTTNTYTVGGTAAGVAGTGLVLQNNGGDDKAVSANGSFTFTTSVESGGAYNITIKTQPSNPTQTCSLSAASGTVTNGNVVTVNVNCATNKYSVGATTSGLAGTGLVLQNNAADDLTVNGNGALAFATTISSGSPYAITVKTQPTNPSQTCTVTNGSGTVAASNVTAPTVTCTTNKYSVGGTVSGATSALVLLNNAGDALTVNADGAFTFATQINSGATYAVTVKTNPTNQQCTVTAGTGTVAAAAVTSVSVSCTVPKTCLAIKTENPAAADGNYVIDVDGAGALAPLTVFCDMTTDGGGYTMYPVTGAISTTRYDQPNTCTALGMQLAIPRSQAHLDAMKNKYGMGYLAVVPGVYGIAAGNYTGCAMNSSDPACAANWKALDGGSWFARAIPFGEPNGDYNPGDWIGGYGGSYDANGMYFNDIGGGYATGSSYICSDNAKNLGTTYGPNHTFVGMTSNHYITQGGCSLGQGVDADALYFCQHFYNAACTAVPGYSLANLAPPTSPKMHKQGGCTGQGSDIPNTTCQGGACKIGNWSETTNGIQNLLCKCP
jgi:hypothetical protein